MKPKGKKYYFRINLPSIESLNEMCYLSEIYLCTQVEFNLKTTNTFDLRYWRMQFMCSHTTLQARKFYKIH